MEARPSSSSQNSTSKITIDQDVKIDATQASSVPQLGLKKVDAYIGGGKLGKSKRGWHSLPPNVIHRILDFSLPKVHLPPVVEESWRRSPELHEVAVVVRRRICLAEWRLVCLGWKKAIDSHSFWPRYTLILDPSKSHHSSVSDLQSSRTTPSTPSYPTLFHRALRTTNNVCLPCRLNHPSRLGLYPARRQYVRYTPHFHRVATCDKHRGLYCLHCLRGGQTLVWLDGGYRTGSSLLKYRPIDFDHEGRRLVQAFNCFSCRQAALEYYVNRQLIQLARGGPIQPVNIVEWINGSDPAQGYILDADDTSRNSANQLIEDGWLHQHTRFTQLRDVADRCVIHDTRLANTYVELGRIETSTEFLRRSETIVKLLCIVPEGAHDFAKRLNRHTLDMYAEVKRLVAATKKEEDGIDEDEDDVDGWLDREDEDEDEDAEPYDREVFWTTECVDSAIDNFVRERIRSGYWVYPSDELATYLGHQTLDPHNLNTSNLPPGIQQHPGRVYTLVECLDSTLKLNPSAAVDYYPTEEVLEQLDNTFRVMLVRYLHGPIALWCRERQRHGWKLGDFDAYIPDASHESTRDLLEYLGKRGEYWGPFLEDLREEQDRQEHEHGNEGEGGRRGQESGHGQIGGGNRQTGMGSESPRIELVQDTETGSEGGNPWDLHSEETEESLESEDDKQLDNDASVTDTENGNKVASVDRGSHHSDSVVHVEGVALASPLAVHPPPTTLQDSDMTDPDSQSTTLTEIMNPPTPTSKEERPEGHPSSSLSNGNGKRKTPPPTSTQHEPATKRRSPTERPTPNREYVSTPTFSEVSTMTSSEVDSSPSDPTDPMPVTPEDLPAGTTLPNTNAHQKGENREQEEGRKTKAPLVRPPAPPLKTAYNDLPHIPSPSTRLGPKTDQTVYEILQRELRPLRQCKCKICARARNLKEMVDAQAEVLGRVYQNGGDAGVRLALGLEELGTW